MKQLLFSLTILLFLSPQAFGQGMKIDFTEYDLDNGLHVILHQDASVPIVAVSVLYHVGSKNEDPKRTGFAHFFEHLMFEGSENIERGQYMEMVQGAGGELNANTSFDRTFYFELLPSNQLELGLWMESERMLHANVDSIGVETQRAVVKEERSQRLDNQPYGTAMEELFKRAFTEHPYQWMPIGSAQYIDEASLQEFMDFYKLFYVPENATLSIAGDINIDETKAMVAKYFGEIPKGMQEIPRPTVVEPAMGGEKRDVIYDNVQLPGVIMGYRIPEQGTDDFYAVRMLSTLLSSGQSSRLYKELVDNQQKALFSGSFPLPTEDPGLALVFSIANMGVSETELENAIDAEMDKVGAELISEREFEKLRNQTENQFISAKSTVAGISESLANYHVYLGDADLINTELDRYMKVTREDIQRVAKEYFNKDNRVVLHYLPKANEDK